MFMKRNKIKGTETYSDLKISLQKRLKKLRKKYKLEKVKQLYLIVEFQRKIFLLKIMMQKAK